MQVYFSLSYRDPGTNGYFLDHFVENDLVVHADQKTDVWCVAKLERYLEDSSGFVSVITQRWDGGVLGYSDYIGHELKLARRFRVPRLLFVDDEVLNTYRDSFPEDAIPFVSGSLQSEQTRHHEAVRRFKQLLDNGRWQSRERRARLATVVVASQRPVAAALETVGAILRSESYHVNVVNGRRLTSGFDDIDLFETLLSSELCVFMLGTGRSHAETLLAMMHARCVPSLRLQYDPKIESAKPDITGLVRWKDTSNLAEEFQRQVNSFRRGFVGLYERAKTTTSVAAAHAVGNSQWNATEDNAWDPADGPALTKHVRPDRKLIQDLVARTHTELGIVLGQDRSRETSLAVFRAIYDAFKNLDLPYQFEPQRVDQRQAIRTPDQMVSHGAATCLDLACFFASVLEACHQNPLIFVLDGKTNSSHALVGYRTWDEPPWSGAPTVGQVLSRVDRLNYVVVEATGVAQSDTTVGAERLEDRKAGKGRLDFDVSRAAGKAMLGRDDLRMRHAVDVRALRALA